MRAPNPAVTPRRCRTRAAIAPGRLVPAPVVVRPARKIKSEQQLCFLYFGNNTAVSHSTRQGRPRIAREVVRRAHARKVAPGEPARSTAPITRRARVSPAGATARSSRRRRYARICVQSMLYRYQTLGSEITFLLVLELINHQNYHIKVSSQHTITYQPRRPTTNRARFRTQRAKGTNEWR